MDNEKPLALARGFHLESGNVLLSRAVSSQVPSALKGLTSVFGMGTGGTLSPLSPEFCQGLVQSAFFLASASSIDNRSIRLGEPPHKLRAFLLFQFHPTNGLSAWSDQTAAPWLPRTLKTAHPDFLHLAKNQSLFNFPFGLT